ncbi:MAG: FecR domain-containing protein [Pseudanabaenaceae cyanobacterium bins.39]|nr:FecR domain-containing protein [Pseudanabaenaceae cyanobacterium bins.39]
MQLRHLSHLSKHFVPIAILTTLGLVGCITSQPPKPFSSETSPTEAIAEISEIRSYPVRVRYTNTSSYTIATVGTPLKVNESVRTEDNSSAQINLQNGGIMRIGGSASLTLKPQNQVEIKNGKLVAWASGDQKSPTQIKTPFGEISTNNGTVYLEIPDQAATERRIISLDGTANLRLQKSSKLISLNKGEEILIKADGNASEPKAITKEVINKYIANNTLLFGFSNQLASLAAITTEFGVTATIKEANTIEFRRSDLPTQTNRNNNKPNLNSTATTNTVTNTNREQKNQAIEQPSETPQDNPKPQATSPETPQPKPVEPTPTNPPASSPPSNPTSEPVAPSPLPNPPPQPAPLEPPPAPVQPEIAPIAPSPKP